MAIWDKNGYFIRMLGVYNNIIKFKEIEIWFLQENNWLDVIFGNFGFYFVIMDLLGRYMYFNDIYKNDIDWFLYILIGEDLLFFIYLVDYQKCIDIVS